MLYLVIKTAITAALVVAIGEVAKRSPLFAGLLASLPLVSVLAILWLYADTRSAGDVARLCWSILLMIPPSLVFFVALPLALRFDLGFAVSLALAIAVTAASYWSYMTILGRFGIRL